MDQRILGRLRTIVSVQSRYSYQRGGPRERQRHLMLLGLSHDDGGSNLRYR